MNFEDLAHMISTHPTAVATTEDDLQTADTAPATEFDYGNCGITITW